MPQRCWSGFVALQRAQLEHSKESFWAGVTRVRESLAGISRNVSGMAAESTEVLGGGREGRLVPGRDGTGLRRYSHGAGGVRGIAVRALHGGGDGGARCAEMSEFVDTIEEIGFRMQRIALNANIKAIRIGEQGSALGAVADAIQRLAADSTDQTQVVARGIREVADGSGRLSAELMESGEELTRELEQVIAAFHAADEENRRRLAEIGETGRSFSQELETLCAGIQADRLLADVIERSCGRLDEIVAAAEPLAAAIGAWSRAMSFRNLEAQYTMHAERAVHQQSTGGGTAGGGSRRGRVGRERGVVLDGNRKAERQARRSMWR